MTKYPSTQIPKEVRNHEHRMPKDFDGLCADAWLTSAR